MSRSLGDRLTRGWLERLSRTDPTTLMGRAIQVVTVDGQGRPHPALLSYGEVVAVDDRSLRLATYADSTTTRNLRERGRLTLCLVDAREVHYVKARVDELPGPPPGHPGLARFEATIEEVLEDQAREDLEADATVVSGIRFEAHDPAGKAREWVALAAALRDAP